MNTTLIKSAFSLVGKYCLYSTILDSVRFRERSKLQAEMEELKIKNARLEAMNEAQKMVIDILNSKPKEEKTEEEQ